MMFMSEVQAVQDRGLARIAERIKLFRTRIQSVPLDCHPTGPDLVRLGAFTTARLGVIIKETEADLWMKPSTQAVDKISVYLDASGMTRYYFHSLWRASYWEDFLDPYQDPKCLAAVMYRFVTASF